MKKSDEYRAHLEREHLLDGVVQTDEGVKETAAYFLAERRDYFYVSVVPGANGWGWDVVLRLDGTYTTREGAQGGAEATRHRLSHLFDVTNEGRIWWDGPPQKQSK